MYVDGFLLAVPKDKIEDYRIIADKAGKIWMEHGALGYYETVGDDINVQGMLSFDDAANVKEGEIPAFSFIIYTSKEHRDEVNKKVMADPRMNEIKPEDMPFDCKNMYYGGFKSIVAFSK